ncbi:hypothetical protein DFH08DRAFT_827985 [Mycena albidolilacea]|uniref:Uncharacterized protein n=1 Tax=Mycena albidolilacea TaxID=1033008 RepID=A0AAD6YXU0_9AGAR|nr:hypothetical protein DFH08DRAFT_827985 [Mycena albidolilacea]
MWDYVAPRHDSNLIATAVNCTQYRTTARGSPGTVEGTGSLDQKEMDVVKQERKTKGFATNEENRKHVGIERKAAPESLRVSQRVQGAMKTKRCTQTDEAYNAQLRKISKVEWQHLEKINKMCRRFAPADLNDQKRTWSETHEADKNDEVREKGCQCTICNSTVTAICLNERNGWPARMSEIFQGNVTPESFERNGSENTH